MPIMNCIPFLKPEKHRDSLIDKGAEMTSTFYIRLASGYPDLQEGWRYRIYGTFQIFTYIVAIYYVLAYVFSTYYAIKYMDVELIGETLCFGVITYVSVTILVVFTVCRGRIDELLRTAGKGVYVYDRPMTAEELAIKNSTEKQASDYGKKAFKVPMTVAAVHVLIIPLSNGLRGRYTSIKNGTAPINKYAAIPVWMPYEAYDARSFFLLLFSQSLPGLLDFGVLHAGITFFVGCSSLLIRDLALLLSSLRDMYDRAVYMYEKKGNKDNGREENFKDPEFQRCMVDCLKENIGHHNLIVRFYMMFQGLFGWTILAVFLGAAVQISTPPYTLVKVAQMGDFDVLMTTGTLMLCHAFLSLYVAYKYCIYGQRVIDLSGDILGAYYDTPWQDCDIKFRRMLIVAMANSQDSLVPSTKVIGVPASMATLLDLVKNSYSLFNLLLTME